jgi:hypothetical protein
LRRYNEAKDLAAAKAAEEKERKDAGDKVGRCSLTLPNPR